MVDDDFNFARMVLEMNLHQNTSDDEVTFGRPDLNYAHKQILRYLSHESWTDRQTLLGETQFQPKQLKKHLNFLDEYDYVEERKKPNERREKQYRRI